MLSVFPDIETLVEAAAELIVESAREAVERRSRFLLALSGGHSPQPLYTTLAHEPYRNKMPWENTIVLWSDERYVPLTDEKSNAGPAMELLLKHVPVHENHVMAMYKDGLSPEQAAKAYEKNLKDLFGGNQPRLDLTLLGCGPDAHTASLFPGSKTIDEQKALILAVNHPGGDVPRITMTPILINLSRTVVFIAYGQEKATAVREVLVGAHRPKEIPAQAIKPSDGEVLWYIDGPAASQLEI